MPGKSLKDNPKLKLIDIDLIVYDFDGVLTDNKVLVFADGTEAVLCNRSDGLAIQNLKERGARQIILSTEKNKVVKARAVKLGIEAIQAVVDKKAALLEYCRQKNIDLKKVVYIGNDINDLAVMKIVGYSVAPKDAYSKIKKIAKILLGIKGGNGVVRAFYEIIQ